MHRRIMILDSPDYQVQQKSDAQNYLLFSHQILHVILHVYVVILSTLNYQAAFNNV